MLFIFAGYIFCNVYADRMKIEVYCIEWNEFYASNEDTGQQSLKRHLAASGDIWSGRRETLRSNWRDGTDTGLYYALALSSCALFNGLPISIVEPPTEVVKKNLSFNIQWATWCVTSHCLRMNLTGRLGNC